MALINCPKCGESMSDQAVKCPHCGSYISKTDASMSVLGFHWKWLLILALVGVLWGLYAADYCAFHKFIRDDFGAARDLWNATNYSLVVTCFFAILLILLKPWRKILKVLFFVGFALSVTLMLVNPMIKSQEMKKEVQRVEPILGKTIPFEYQGTKYELKVSDGEYEYSYGEVFVECKITSASQNPKIPCVESTIYAPYGRDCYAVRLIATPPNYDNDIYLFVDKDLKGYEIGTWDGPKERGSNVSTSAPLETSQVSEETTDNVVESAPEEDNASLSDEGLEEIEKIGYGLSKEIAVPNHDIEYCTRNDEANLKAMYEMASSKCDFPKNQQTYQAFRRGFLNAYKK